MINLTVFTIIYNDYGKFLDDWLKNLRKQTLKPKEIIVVLGKGHNVDITTYKGVKFIECDSDVMGVLRNEAIKAKRFKKVLYFSVDDELLPNAIQQIDLKFNQGFNLIGLRYLDRSIIATKEDINGNISYLHKDIKRESYIPTAKAIKNWRKSGVPGYIAVNGKYEYEPIEIPNYPYIFKLVREGLAVAHTDEVVAIYHRRKGSHGDTSVKQRRFKEFASIIDSYAKEEL